MSVLIKGLEIPEEGAIRVVIQKHCGIAVAYTGEDPYQRAHEVVELPEKHGRLVDADALKDTLDYYIREAGWSEEINKALGWVKDEFIDSERTIVEAEGK